MTADPNATDRGTVGADAADTQVDQVPDSSADPGSYGDRGDSAESAAFLEEGAYSGGEFAGGGIQPGDAHGDLG